MAMTSDRPGQDFKVIGKSMPRVDGIEKVTGAAKFGADYSIPGMLWGKVVRSTVAHANIKNLDVSAAEKYPGVACVLTGKDITYAPHDPTSRNNNPLARTKVIFFGQPIAVIAATSKEIADEAAQLIKIEYEPLPVLVDPVDAMQEGATLLRHEGTGSEQEEDEVDRSEMNIHAADAATQSQEESNLPNVTSQIDFKQGDVEQAFKESDVIVEHTFRVAIFHQAYMEPHAALAQWAPDGTLTMWITSQGLFAMRDQLTRFFQMPASKVKVHATEIGGGFGGKFGLLTTLTAAAARKAKRPVKIVISRSEEFIAANPAPYTFMQIKTGCKQDGTLTAIEARVVMDTGAYPTSPLFSAHYLGGSYKVPNFKIDGYEVLTNKANVGAYRAPGAPEVCFAIEACMDDMARQVGMDPIDFRLKNCIEEGDKWPSGTVMRRIGARACMEAAKNHPIWTEPLQEGEGKGFGIGVWGGGAGASEAVVRVNNDGTFTILTGTVNLTGATTALAQVAAEELGVPLENVSIVTADSTEAPISPASGGSQITYSMGHAISLAAQDARRKLLEYAANMLEAAVEDLEVVEGTIQVRGVPATGAAERSSLSYSEVASRAGGRQGPISGYGSFKPEGTSPGYSATVARVKVDKETGAVTVTRLLGIQDVGRAINPMAVEGQIQGGVAQGVGMALTEEVMYDQQGRVLNPGFLDYRLLTFPDLPEIETEIVEVPADFGPYGARIVGEPSIVPPGAAVANAITDAAGVRVTNIPIIPERLLAALKKQQPA